MPYSTSYGTISASRGIYTAENIEDFEYLIEAGLVESYYPLGYIDLFGYETSDKYYSEQTNLSQISAQFAWDKANFGKGAKVAIIDTGFSKQTGDFNMSNIVLAYDCDENTNTSESTYCKDTNISNHGTSVAGIIAAAHNTRGIAGIAPECTLYIFKCRSTDKQINTKDILTCFYKAIDEYECDIINMSFGDNDPDLFKDVAAAAEEKGVLIVAAAGNNGNSVLKYPASYDSVISVGSLTESNEASVFSQKNDKVNIMAPGENVWTTLESGYAKCLGTSHAAPHVAAAAALAKSLNPSLSAKELREALCTTADPLPTVDFSGSGRLNVQALLTLVRATLSPGERFFSQDDNYTYVSFVPPEGYRSYLALYNKDVLYNVSVSGYLRVHNKVYSTMRQFIWGKDSLSPYTGEYTITEY